MSANSERCVYLYRSTRDQRIRYVGRGASPARAVGHTGGTHNPGLARLIESGAYTIEIAGPYTSARDAALVEAALLSALRLKTADADLTNRVAGDGPRFRPLGVPHNFADRLALPPLSVSEIGRITGGALLVRNSFGNDLEPGRPRLDPVNPQDSIVRENIRRYWLLEPVRPGWIARPASAPRVLIGAAGPPTHRYIAGAALIDIKRLATTPDREVPLIKDESADLDACKLRGRLIFDLRFDQGRQSHFIWVDGRGVRRYDKVRPR